MVEQQDRYLDFLINPSFQGLNRLFVLSFQNSDDRTSYMRYYLPLVEIKDYNVAIYGQNIFDQPVKKNFITYDNIRKTQLVKETITQLGVYYDYNNFNNYYKMIATDLSK